MWEVLALYHWQYILYCEAIHFLFSSLAALAVCYPTWIICKLKWPGVYTGRSFLLLALFVGSLLHAIIDFTPGIGFC
jgi:hypothetical protein